MLFPNEAVVMLLARVIGMLGPVDMDMLERGQETQKYFTKDYDLYHINEVCLLVHPFNSCKIVLLTSLAILCWYSRECLVFPCFHIVFSLLHFLSLNLATYMNKI